jgi:hypothetical protein
VEKTRARPIATTYVRGDETFRTSYCICLDEFSMEKVLCSYVQNEGRERERGSNGVAT